MYPLDGANHLGGPYLSANLGTYLCGWSCCSIVLVLGISANYSLVGGGGRGQKLPWKRTLCQGLVGARDYIIFKK